MRRNRAECTRDVEAGILNALASVDAADMRGYYRHCGYRSPTPDEDAAEEEVLALAPVLCGF